MQICNNKECQFYSEEIADNCANETLCNLADECKNHLSGLCAIQKEITEEINRLQNFIKEPSYSDEEKHTKDMCRSQIPAYKHCLELLKKLSIN
jgi:hypothetical protein